MMMMMMMMILQQTIIRVVILTILVISSTKADYFTNCNRTCGNGTQNRRHHDLPYPFGFSVGCPIQLNCSDSGNVSIGEFEVQNITGDSLLINLPEQCNRTIDDIKGLFGHNYALTWQNGLLLQNCTTQPKNCVLPIGMMGGNGLESQSCVTGKDNISCYSVEHQFESVDFMTFDNLNSTSCRVLYSSIAVDLSNNSNGNSVVSLEFHTVALGWWMDVVDEQNKCSSNADYRVVSLAGGKKGFRCYCKKGFQGDGFADGGGCRKVPKCNASGYMSGRCGGTKRVIILIAGIIAGTSLMAAVAFLCCYLRRRSTSLRSRMSAKRLLCEAAGSSSIPLFTYKEIERSTNGFAEKQRLGTGAYGTVYAGKLHNDEWVAIKKLRYRDTEGIEQVMNEIRLLSSVSHPNLVRLLGCCIENGEQILVYEFMANGTLSQHLQRERGKGLPWTIRLTIATETAHAIAHLHNAMNPPIYHRDIKSSNILLDYQYNSKVADFGLSRLGMTDDSHISTAPQGTPGYLDPQYHQNFHLSDKSDVYSFGVVLVEIISALKVVDFSRPHCEVNLAALAIDRIGKGCVDEIIDPFLDPNRDAWTLSSIHKVAELAFRCLAFHRDMRPSMMEVANELEQIRISGWAPMDENICGASSVASYCSSLYDGVGSVGSRTLVVPQRAVECLIPMEEVQDCSPVSVHDPWLSAQSSPSTNSLLGNVVK